MLLIRAQQEARLKEGARSAFLTRVEKHVVAAHPDCVGAFGSDELRQFVERNWEAARSFGLTSERGLCLYLEAVCKFGEDFPKTRAWAGILLMSPDFEDKKVGQLREHLEVSNSRNGSDAHSPARVAVDTAAR